MKNNYDSTKNGNTENDTSFSDCHHTGNQNNITSSATVSETNADQDSANSKYVVENDDRERRDGPGGN